MGEITQAFLREGCSYNAGKDRGTEQSMLQTSLIFSDGNAELDLEALPVDQSDQALVLRGLYARPLPQVNMIEVVLLSIS